MIAAKKPFPSTRCEARDDRTFEAQHQYIGDDEKVRTGYTLIGDALVPESFIERVLRQMGRTYCIYGTVLKKERVFLEDFLESLTPEEHEVLMPVALELMARGQFPLHLDPETDLSNKNRVKAKKYGA
jgi:hypothetical protein